MNTGRLGFGMGALAVCCGFGVQTQSWGQLADEEAVDEYAAEADVAYDDLSAGWETLPSEGLPDDAVFAAVTPRGACGYAYDDGTRNGSLSDLSNELCWMHRLDAQSGCERITSISVSWAGVTAVPSVGAIASVCVWDDPDDDGNPINAVLVAQEQVTVQTNIANSFDTYTLSAPPEVDGVFFIGAVFRPVFFSTAPFDTSSAYIPGRAWLCRDAGGVDRANLANNDFPPQDLQQITAPGYFLLRADATPGLREISYQGRLKQNGDPYNGVADVRFTLYDAETGGTVLDGPETLTGVTVADGLFSVCPEFLVDSFFDIDVWLNVEVAAPSGSGFVPLSPRQPIKPAPQAHYASVANRVLTPVSWNDLVDVPTGLDGHSLDASDGSPADALLIDTDGDVLIGTTTPGTHRLRVSYSPSSGIGEMVQIDSPVPLVATQDVLALETASGSADDSQFIECTRGGTNVFVVNGNGDVGIGTGAPAAALHVAGVAGTDGIMFPDGSLQTTAATGSADGHSLDASDGSPVDAVFVDATGRVGISTTTPGAKLHVVGVAGSDGIMFPDATLQTTAARGDGHSLDASDGNPTDAVSVDAEGDVVIGTTTTGTHKLRVAAASSSISEIVQIDNASPMGGLASLLALEMVFGSPDTAQFIKCVRPGTSSGFAVNGNGAVGIGTTGPAAKLHVVDATGGDSSVILPNNAVSALEMLNEPGAAESEYDQPQIALDGTVQTLLSTTITAPAAGYALVIASAQCSFVQHVNGTTSDANFGVSNVAGSLPINQDVELLISTAAPTGTYRFPVSVHGVFPVVTGANTFYFLGQELSGSAVAQDIQLTAVYLPTAYGAVTAMLGDGEPDDPDYERGPLTFEEIEAERMEAIFLEEERIERERQELAAEIEELRALKYGQAAMRDEMYDDIHE